MYGAPRMRGAASPVREKGLCARAGPILDHGSASAILSCGLPHRQSPPPPPIARLPSGQKWGPRQIQGRGRTYARGVVGGGFEANTKIGGPAACGVRTLRGKSSPARRRQLNARLGGRRYAVRAADSGDAIPPPPPRDPAPPTRWTQADECSARAGTHVRSVRARVCSKRGDECSTRAAVCSIHPRECSRRTHECSIRARECSIHPRECSKRAAVCSIRPRECSIRPRVCSKRADEWSTSFGMRRGHPPPRPPRSIADARHSPRFRRGEPVFIRAPRRWPFDPSRRVPNGAGRKACKSQMAKLPNGQMKGRRQWGVGRGEA